ncbi:hypothetical protein L1D32_15835 [Shewanella insulae]|uniref:hypothetical protein n=1 Tax=Shewanella insulae TaxID=2681496 RepID=UPI001EFD4AA9|nr:hypothetical protein [Shewanella insulae]MCG9739634.1 hypothetical protein [Shewanella insulae]
MIKLKLYKIHGSITPDEILSKINETLYSDEQGFGFEIIDSSPESFTAQFTERTIKTQTYELITGEEQEVETVSYLRVRFGIRFGSEIALYVINPPRSMKYPYEMIRTIFKKENKLQPVSLNLSQMVDDFDSKYEQKITSLSLSNIQCDMNTIAKTKLVSNQNLYAYYKEHYGNTDALIDIVEMTVNSMSIECSRTGRIKLAEVKLKDFLLMADYCTTQA